MRITITLPDALGTEVKARTDNVSAFVAEALVEYLVKIRRREARNRLRTLAGSAEIEPAAHDLLLEERRDDRA